MLEDYFSSLLHEQSDMLFASDRQYISAPQNGKHIRTYGYCA